jgi:hypothetical protein
MNDGQLSVVKLCPRLESNGEGRGEDEAVEDAVESPDDDDVVGVPLELLSSESVPLEVGSELSSELFDGEVLDGRTAEGRDEVVSSRLTIRGLGTGASLVSMSNLPLRANRRSSEDSLVPLSGLDADTGSQRKRRPRKTTRSRNLQFQLEAFDDDRRNRGDADGEKPFRRPG